MGAVTLIKVMGSRLVGNDGQKYVRFREKNRTKGKYVILLSIKNRILYFFKAF